MVVDGLFRFALGATYIAKEIVAATDRELERRSITPNAASSAASGCLSKYNNQASCCKDRACPDTSSSRL